MDLSIIFTVKVPAGEGTNGTINVKQEHMANWGVDSEELYEAAMANIKDDWNIVPMQDILFKITDFKACENMFFPLNMYVVSNHDGMYGASVILNNDVLDDVDVLSNHIYAYNRKSHRLEVENLSEEGTITKGVPSFSRDYDVQMVSKLICQQYKKSYNVLEKVKIKEFFSYLIHMKNITMLEKIIEPREYLSDDRK